MKTIIYLRNVTFNMDLRGNRIGQSSSVGFDKYHESSQVSKQVESMLVAAMALEIAEHAMNNVTSVGFENKDCIDVRVIRQQLLSQRLLIEKIRNDIMPSPKFNSDCTLSRVLTKTQKQDLICHAFNYLADTNGRYAIVKDPEWSAPEYYARLRRESARSGYNKYDGVSECQTNTDPLITFCNSKLGERRHYKLQLVHTEKIPKESSHVVEYDAVGCRKCLEEKSCRDSLAVEHTPDDQSEQHGDQQEHNPSIDAGEQTVDTAGNRSCELI